MGKRGKKQPQIETITVDRFLNRNGVQAFVVFSLFVLWAFWPSYFSRLLDEPETRVHAHGLSLTLWCVLLILQAYLIRTKQRQTHRFVGKFSYVLVPMIVAATIHLVHFRMQGIEQPTSIDLYRIALMVNAVIAFIVIYGLAILYRKTAHLHARYMICTVLPLFTPVTDRLIYGHFQSLLDWVPVLDGTPLVQVIGFGIADAILIALTLWDWRSNHRVDAFAVALGVMTVYHVSVLTFYQTDFWRAFGHWFLSLPLS